MAGNRGKKAEAAQPSGIRGKWAERIEAASSAHSTFHGDGDTVVSRYRLEKENNKAYWQDKYNILYSSTETMKPSLYAQTPKVQAVNRHKDRTNENVVLGTMLMEAATQYGMEEIDFDDVMTNVVEDYLLPGFGTAWVRYDPEISTVGEGDDAYETVSYEGLALDYVYWKDFLSDSIKVWQDKRWIARRVYFDKAAATKRFGEDKAARLQYSYTSGSTEKDSGRTTGLPGDQAIIWEIWDKDNREVLWFSTDYPDGLLDQKPDPLKLKDFWPCPRPLRAVSTTSTFLPKAFYSQYKAQAETLDDITQRIRWLTKALRVVGVYDASQTELSKLLNGTDNRMVPVENWAQFAGQGGINGSIQWVPIKEVATVLGELYKQREIAKNEIYEITGFSDITRGVSKASETLGAQEIKNQWANGRLRSLQKEVQRFCRDIIRIMSEIIVENFSDESLAMYAGFEPPPITPEEQQASAQYAAQKLQYDQGGLTLGMPAPTPPPPTMQQQAVQKFREVLTLVRQEKRRCALIGIETDSTIQPDEAAERKDRMEFLGQIGAFLQQAGPMALQYPDMRGLLAAIMMFTIRTFRASRPLEKEFEEFQKSLANAPPMPPPGSEGEGGKQGADPAQLQADQAKEELKAKTVMDKAASDAQIKKYEIDQRTQLERERMQMEMQYKERELALKERELQVRESEILIKSTQTSRQEDRADTQLEHQQNVDVDNAERANREVGVKEKQAAKKPAAKTD